MKNNRRRLNYKSILIAVVMASLFTGLSGCITTKKYTSNVDQTVADEQHTITTYVFYRQRIALPPGAQVSLILEDVSKIDAAAEIVAQQTVAAIGGPPYKMELSYNATLIKPQHHYALRAEITRNDQLLFTNTVQVDVFANRNAVPTEILVSRVHSDAKGEHQANVMNTHWQLSMLDTQQITSEVTQQQPYLIFTEENKQVVGFAGCNRFSGRYDVLADKVNLTELLTTKKLCFQQMNLETQFLAALSAAEHYEVINSTLTLYDNTGIVLGQFIAQKDK